MSTGLRARTSSLSSQTAAARAATPPGVLRPASNMGSVGLPQLDATSVRRLHDEALALRKLIAHEQDEMQAQQTAISGWLGLIDEARSWIEQDEVAFQRWMQSDGRLQSVQADLRAVRAKLSRTDEERWRKESARLELLVQQIEDAKAAAGFRSEVCVRQAEQIAKLEKEVNALRAEQSSRPAAGGDSFKADMQALNAKLASTRAQVEEANKELEALRQFKAKAESMLAEKGSSATRVAQLQKEVAESREQQAELRRLRQQIETMRAENRSLEARMRRMAEKEVSEVFEEEREDLLSQVSALRAQILDLQEEIQQGKSKHETTLNEMEQLKKLVVAKAEQVKRLNAQIESMRQASAEAESLSGLLHESDEVEERDEDDEQQDGARADADTSGHATLSLDRVDDLSLPHSGADTSAVSAARRSGAASARSTGASPDLLPRPSPLHAAVAATSSSGGGGGGLWSKLRRSVHSPNFAERAADDAPDTPPTVPSGRRGRSVSIAEQANEMSSDARGRSPTPPLSAPGGTAGRSAVSSATRPTDSAAGAARARSMSRDSSSGGGESPALLARKASRRTVGSGEGLAALAAGAAGGASPALAAQLMQLQVIQAMQGRAGGTNPMQELMNKDFELWKAKIEGLLLKLQMKDQLLEERVSDVQQWQLEKKESELEEQARAELLVLRQSIEKLEQEKLALQQELQRAAETIGKKQSDLSALSVAYLTMKRDLEAAREQVDALRTQVSTNAGFEKEFADTLGELRRALAAREAEITRLQGMLAEEAQQRGRLQADLSQCRAREDALRSSILFLSDMVPPDSVASPTR